MVGWEWVVVVAEDSRHARDTSRFEFTYSQDVIAHSLSYV